MYFYIIVQFVENSLMFSSCVILQWHGAMYQIMFVIFALCHDWATILPSNILVRQKTQKTLAAKNITKSKNIFAHNKSKMFQNLLTKCAKASTNTTFQQSTQREQILDLSKILCTCTNKNLGMKKNKKHLNSFPFSLPPTIWSKHTCETYASLTCDSAPFLKNGIDGVESDRIVISDAN